MRDVLERLGHHAKTRPAVAALSDPTCTLNFESLAGRVAARANAFQDLPQTIAILAPNSTQWVICDLALALAGKTFVPLPTFFAPKQLQHIINDAGVAHILATQETEAEAKALALPLGLPVTVIEDDFITAPWPDDLSPVETSVRVIYTSGTTGAPKGVRIGAKQISTSARGLLSASSATQDDVYLSVLPFSLLLEQIAAICVPLLAGASVTIDPNVAGAALQGDPRPLVQAFAVTRPTASVLVPGLLGAWVMGLQGASMTAPETLRFVAVGGAPVPDTLAQTAWTLGIPAHEGYGLSECCSVVSVNRPGHRVPGTAGHVLGGITVTIDDGEIVVSGPTVMDGYLGRDDIQGGVWRTGDVGEFTAEGALKVLGRKDRLIVTPAGRNIHPEWIEALALTAPGVAQAKLTLTDDGTLTLTVTPRADAQDNLTDALRMVLSEAPAYAQPTRIIVEPLNASTGS